MSNTTIQQNGWQEVKLGSFANISKQSWKVGDDTLTKIANALGVGVDDLIK